MHLIFCLDDNQGMMFNKRRQSRDSEVIKDILKSVGEQKIWMSAYSSRIFTKPCTQIEISSSPWKAAGNDDFCFIEDTDPNLLLSEQVKKVIVYRWNRDYPEDLYCSIDFSELRCIKETNFSGSSHEKIKKTIYEIKENIK